MERIIIRGTCITGAARGRRVEPRTSGCKSPDIWTARTRVEKCLSCMHLSCVCVCVCVCARARAEVVAGKETFPTVGWLKLSQVAGKVASAFNDVVVKDRDLSDAGK